MFELSHDIVARPSTMFVVQNGHEIDMCCDNIGMGAFSVTDFILRFIMKTRLGGLTNIYDH
jgi:hypothetical protein